MKFDYYLNSAGNKVRRPIWKKESCLKSGFIPCDKDGNKIQKVTKKANKKANKED